MSDARFNESGHPTTSAKADEEALQELFAGYRGVDEDYVHAGRDALERWWDMKFGIRINWGLYSVPGHGPEAWRLTDHPDNPHDTSPQFRAQYERLYKWWNPSLFNADEWCDMMVRAGMKFFTFTTKQHDGFSMFDTKTKVKRRLVHTGPASGKIVDCDLHYSITETPFGRDIVRELVDAARRRDLGIGLYFSNIDWFDSDFRIDKWNYQRDDKYTRKSDPAGFNRMIARHREQLRELCTNYGRIDILSLDMRFPDDGRIHGIRNDIVETIKMVRRLQPEVLIRRRGIDPYGDYYTPERVVPDSPEAAVADMAMPWKVIYPGGKHFSRVWLDEYKPAEWVIENLVDITAKGGVFQVGYSAGPDGCFDEEAVRELDRVGAWLRVNGEGIYSTRPYRAFREQEHIRFTQSKDGRIVYAIIADPCEQFSAGKPLRLESVRAKSGSAIRMLGLDHDFEYRQDDKALSIEIPAWFVQVEHRPCETAYTFRIETG